MYKTRAEYIWVDGTEKTPKLRSKTKVLDTLVPLNVARASLDLKTGKTTTGAASYVEACSYPVNHELVPLWGFDGSSTNQAPGDKSDCILVPVRVVPDPIRADGSLLVLCEVRNVEGDVLTPGVNNNRDKAEQVANKFAEHEPMFGIEQEYTLFKGHAPLGWPEGGFPAPQGPFYCGVGADEVFGREIVEDHMAACLAAGLKLSGVNAEVMPGQWEFQIGPADTLEVGDHLWLARYLLYRIAEGYGVNVRLDPKPVHGDWNGAGAHTNFSTKAMREEGGFEVCLDAAKKLGLRASGLGDLEEGQKVGASNFPEVYGDGYQQRLTGKHETCSYEYFKYGVADRTASVRIPLHVKMAEKGYIEDRRPCANIDPYQVTVYLIETTCS